MPLNFPDLKQFRVEPARDGLIHLVFDMPDRTMNVFSNEAIRELGLFARWLATAQVAGVVIRSGKKNAFCAGADLAELGVAYDMIMKSHPQLRYGIAFDHFFPLSRAIRALETAGKPVAAAIGGLALGGGCELALGAHYRVLVDHPRVELGLPESLVGLLPGAGGTQRLPRLIGLEVAFDVLLHGRRLSGGSALAAGLVDELVQPGEEVNSAERWLLDNPQASQPWDRRRGEARVFSDVIRRVEERRNKELQQSLGHYPAPLAILDCLMFGYAQPIDAAIRTEMSIFADLIQRTEARNMIQTLFLGKLDYERAERKDAVPDPVVRAITTLEPVIRSIARHPSGASLGFGAESGVPVRRQADPGYWFETSTDPNAADARRLLDEVVENARQIVHTVTATEQRMADYAIVSRLGFPAYLGGPFALTAHRATGPSFAERVS